MIVSRTISEIPVSLDTFRRHARITSNAFDAQLELALQAAVSACESYIGQAIAPSTILERMDYAPVMTIVFPDAVITSVKVDDNALDNEKWSLSGKNLVIDAKGKSVEVAYTAGMPKLDPAIEAAILLKATSLFDNPSDSVQELTTASENLLIPFKCYG